LKNSLYRSNKVNLASYNFPAESKFPLEKFRGSSLMLGYTWLSSSWQTKNLSKFPREGKLKRIARRSYTIIKLYTPHSHQLSSRTRLNDEMRSRSDSVKTPSPLRSLNLSLSLSLSLLLLLSQARATTIAVRRSSLSPTASNA
jgi:hypothetical protein